MKKSIFAESKCEIVIDPIGDSGRVTLAIFGTYDPTVELTIVELTIDECAQLGSALYSIASTHRRRAANDGAIYFKELAIGQRFRFVNHLPNRICTRIDGANLISKWHNYAMPDGRTAHTSANAKVIVVE